MKVKELIEKLEKENPNNEIHIVVDFLDNEGIKPYHAIIDNIIDYDIRYLDIDNECLSEQELIEKIEEENNIDCSWTELKIQNVIDDRMKKQKKIEGLYLYSTISYRGLE
jgi:hypothetical protein